MNRVSAKVDCAVLAVVNAITWFAQFDAIAKTALTVLSLVFLAHRYWHWNKHKDDPKRGESVES